MTDMSHHSVCGGCDCLPACRLLYLLQKVAWRHQRARAVQRVCDATDGHHCHCINHQLCHHHDPQQPLREGCHLDNWLWQVFSLFCNAWLLIRVRASRSYRCGSGWCDVPASKCAHALTAIPTSLALCCLSGDLQVWYTVDPGSRPCGVCSLLLVFWCSCVQSIPLVLYYSGVNGLWTSS